MLVQAALDKASGTNLAVHAECPYAASWLDKHPDVPRGAAGLMFVWTPDWLDRHREEALEPDLPIIDPHHHLWDGGHRLPEYLVADLQADTGAGHRVEATVFIDCKWSYRSDGPERCARSARPSASSPRPRPPTRRARGSPPSCRSPT